MKHVCLVKCHKEGGCWRRWRDWERTLMVNMKQLVVVSIKHTLQR